MGMNSYPRNTSMEILTPAKIDETRQAVALSLSQHMRPTELTVWCECVFPRFYVSLKGNVRDGVLTVRREVPQWQINEIMENETFARDLIASMVRDYATGKYLKPEGGVLDG